MAKLTIPESLYQQVRGHLLQDDDEHLAFFLCNVGWSKGQPLFLAQEAVIVADANLRGAHRYHLDLELEGLLPVVNKAIKLRKALVEAHGHSFAEYPDFSASDRAGLREFVPYALGSVKGMPYAATIWGKKGVAGLSWSSWPQKGEVLDITIVGERLEKVSARASLPWPKNTGGMTGRYGPSAVKLRG